MVSRPTSLGGLGFGMKWDMGWMHDTLQYLEREPIHRRYHQGELTFRMVYAFTENFCLPLSHDEVVHGKGSLLGKMPGDHWQKMANLRALYGYQFGQPGKKLLFMGAELAQETEWDHDGSLPWWLLDRPDHAGHAGVGAPAQRAPRRRARPPPGRRRARGVPVGRRVRCRVLGALLAAVAAARPRRPARRRRARGPRRVQLHPGSPRAATTSGSPGRAAGPSWPAPTPTEFGGSGVHNAKDLVATEQAIHGFAQSLALDLPPLGVVFLAPEAP